MLCQFVRPLASRTILIVMVYLGSVLGGTTGLVAHAEEPSPRAAEYLTKIHPLLLRHCSECHNADLSEADIDLTAFRSPADLRQHVAVWQKVVEVVETEQMPPPEAMALAEADRAVLVRWLREFLAEEAARYAGDPGPVLLRRLSHAEYTYALRDLTGVLGLSPAAEFPVDGAAGEGFTNTGQSLAMSPALLAKYLAAGKQVAAHAVLTPTGLRFSPSTFRRDWIEEELQAIRGLYARYSAAADGAQVNLQGVVFKTNSGGRLPIERYLVALAETHTTRRAGELSFVDLAQQKQLSPRYLAAVAGFLEGQPNSAVPGRLVGSPPGTAAAAQATGLLQPRLQRMWHEVITDFTQLQPMAATDQSVTSPADDPASRIRSLPTFQLLCRELAAWQTALWRENNVGHVGKVNGPKSWMEPIDPIVARQELRWKAPADRPGEHVAVQLVTTDAGDGSAGDLALWERPRLVAAGRPDLLLRDVPRAVAVLTARRAQAFAEAAACLAAAGEIVDESAGVTAEELDALAQRHRVSRAALECWLSCLGLDLSGSRRIGALIDRTTRGVGGYEFVSGWVGDDALSVLANSSDQHVRIPGNSPGQMVVVHPSPTQQVGIAWRAPLTGTVSVTGTVQHAHPECGNGVTWTLESRQGQFRQTLGTGISHGAAVVPLPEQPHVSVRSGDWVTLLIGPRDGNHSCDLTAVELKITAGTETWSLSQDVAPNILAGNPHSDRLGHAEVWHFFREPAGGGTQLALPADSLLDRWRKASGAERSELAQRLQAVLATAAGTDTARSLSDLPATDQQLVQLLSSLTGPLLSPAWSEVANLAGQPPTTPRSDSIAGWPIVEFGRRPDGSPTEPATLCVAAPSVLTFPLPAELLNNAELVVTAMLDPEQGREGTVQLQVLDGTAGDSTTQSPADGGTGIAAPKPQATAPVGPWTAGQTSVQLNQPIFCRDDSAARERVAAGFREFRELFPPALCYYQIVPVDEVITLTQFFREDTALTRLMLTDAEATELDRHWSDLRFISQEPLTAVDAFEQLWQYATQDADPSAFEPLREPIRQRAAAFRQELIDAEPGHVAAVIAWADRAYRRPLTSAEADGLRRLYQQFRVEELSHDDAIRLLLARVCVSSGFLYKAERGVPPDASTPATPLIAGEIATRPLSGDELATRLSLLLWSSIPDEELRAAAGRGDLRTDEGLRTQLVRMLADPKCRRWATEFGCQWLHIYDFDQHDEKSPATFPEFSAVRGDLYEEAIRFLTDQLQRNGTVLELLDADDVWVNRRLAEFYRLDWPEHVANSPTAPSDEWRRLSGAQAQHRGGILGLGATLAKQSGASRTSPILRGNWVSEVLLGEKLPKPPKGVPVLPETVPDGVTERQLIEMHSSVASCAKCHARIDPLGFSLEAYDGIGRYRSTPAGQTAARLLDGTEFDGLPGLRNYLLNQRQRDFTRQFTKKLLGYALGRSVQLSDEPLLTSIQSQLESRGFPLHDLLAAIVLSPQFRTIRTEPNQLIGDRVGLRISPVGLPNEPDAVSPIVLSPATE